MNLGPYQRTFLRVLLLAFCGLLHANGLGIAQAGVMSPSQAPTASISARSIDVECFVFVDDLPDPFERVTGEPYDALSPLAFTAPSHGNFVTLNHGGEAFLIPRPVAWFGEHYRLRVPDPIPDCLLKVPILLH